MMNVRTFGAVLALGLAAVAWVAWGFVGSSPLALSMTAAIAAVFLLGVHELWQFARASHTLRRAVVQTHQPVADLVPWLEQVHPSLQAAVRQRIDGARIALPAPALTPYLVGLLVMLGMLGTFLGMVLTFKGAAFALEGSTNLDAIRAALAAPIQGLGLSFGTSVAGVATSALLGLLATLCRRDRQEVVRLLDACAGQHLRAFSPAHQRDTLLHALQAQALALPQVVEQLQALRTQLEQRQDQLGQQLLAQQDRFHADTSTAYRQLATHVGDSLQTSLQTSAHTATDTLRNLVVQALSDLREQAFAQQAQQLAGFETALAAHSREILQRMQTQAEQVHSAQQAATASLLTQAQTLVEQQAQAQERELQHHAQRLDALQSATALHLTALGNALEAPIARLVETAAQAPRAAAEVIAQLRQEMTQLGERDNRALAERTAMLEQVASLLATVEQASTHQRAAIDALVQSATSVLEESSSRFAQALQAQREQVNDVAAQVNASAIELSSLGQAFGLGVERFSQSNDQLVGSLQALQGSVQQSLERSDEQLGYYVAQAREVIDLSLTAQQGLLEDLRRLHAQPPGVLA